MTFTLQEFEEYIETLSTEEYDEMYCTPSFMAKEVLNGFLKYIEDKNILPQIGFKTQEGVSLKTKRYILDGQDASTDMKEGVPYYGNLFTLIKKAFHDGQSSVHTQYGEIEQTFEEWCEENWPKGETKTN